MEILGMQLEAGIFSSLQPPILFKGGGGLERFTVLQLQASVMFIVNSGPRQESGQETDAEGLSS